VLGSSIGIALELGTDSVRHCNGNTSRMLRIGLEFHFYKSGIVCTGFGLQKQIEC
jgi:hypothetical protein